MEQPILKGNHRLLKGEYAVEIGGTYFDAVLNEAMIPLFNGTTTETKEWLRGREIDASWRVCYGPTMQLIDVFDYLDRF
jgi:hypothetical protein